MSPPPPPPPPPSVRRLKKHGLQVLVERPVQAEVSDFEAFSPVVHGRHVHLCITLGGGCWCLQGG